MKKWLKDMLSSEGNVSSKRVNGTIGFICFIIFVAIWRKDIIDLLGYISAGLLGLEAVANIFSKK